MLKRFFRWLVSARKVTRDDLETTAWAIIMIMLVAPAVAAPGHDVIIVYGQSNAAGRGLGSAMYSVPHTQGVIRQIGRDGSVDMLDINVSLDPLHHWEHDSFPNTRGFALNFARLYKDNWLSTGRKIVLVPAAKGGSGMQTLSSGAYWNDLLARTDAAMALPGDNRLVGFLFHQMETNVIQWQNGNGISPAQWRLGLTQMVNALRNRYGDASATMIALAGEPVRTWMPDDPVKAQFIYAANLAIESVGYGKVISSVDLQSNLDAGVGTDAIHFSAAAQMTLGARYFDAFIEIMRVCRL